MRAIFYAIVLLAVIIFSGCGFVPEKVSFSDPRLIPMLDAIAKVDRTSLGFTPIQTNAIVRLESRSHDRYDAMLHIDGDTSRTIAFRKTASGYKWISEQEIYTGPKTYTTVDGTFHEEISVTYETEHVSEWDGFQLNKIFVQYFGEDTRLTNRNNLTLADVKPILAEWNQKR